MVDVELAKKYFDPKHPGAFAGVEQFYKSQKSASRQQVKHFLKAQASYTLHFPARVRFERNKVVVGSVNQLWDTDLLSMQNLAEDNENYNYIITAVDVLSKHAYCEMLKSKNARSVVAGFRKILQRARDEERLPLYIRSDRGSEYNNSLWRRLMTEYGLKHYMTFNTEIKANFAEIFQKGLKRKIYKSLTHRQSREWTKQLDDLVWNYNHSFHRTIGMSPAVVVPGRTEEIAWRRQYESGPPPKPDGDFRYKVGDLVRLSHVAKVFRREYHQKFTEEVFRVTSRKKRAGLNIYTMEDVSGDVLLGSFYQKELQGVRVNLSGTFVVEHVIRSKKVKGKTQYLVKWRGYDSKFNSWLKDEDFVPTT
jgi:hypothetical protein